MAGSVTAKLRGAFLVGVLLCFWISPVLAQRSPPSSQDPEVTPTDVKRFLDPTVLTNGLHYGFGYANQLDGSAFAHTFSFDVSPNAQHALFADIPVVRATGGGPAETGIGDIEFGYVFVPYERLERRFTTVALRFTSSMPTGDEHRGLGLGTWVLSPPVRSRDSPVIIANGSN